jgi:chromosome segregation ATPase
MRACTCVRGPDLCTLCVACAAKEAMEAEDRASQLRDERAAVEAALAVAKADLERESGARAVAARAAQQAEEQTQEERLRLQRALETVTADLAAARATVATLEERVRGVDQDGAAGREELVRARAELASLRKQLEDETADSSQQVRTLTAQVAEAKAAAAAVATTSAVVDEGALQQLRTRSDAAEARCSTLEEEARTARRDVARAKADVAAAEAKLATAQSDAARAAAAATAAAAAQTTELAQLRTALKDAEHKLAAAERVSESAVAQARADAKAAQAERATLLEERTVRDTAAAYVGAWSGRGAPLVTNGGLPFPERGRPRAAIPLRDCASSCRNKKMRWKRMTKWPACWRHDSRCAAPFWLLSRWQLIGVGAQEVAAARLAADHEARQLRSELDAAAAKTAQATAANKQTMERYIRARARITYKRGFRHTHHGCVGRGVTIASLEQLRRTHALATVDLQHRTEEVADLQRDKAALAVRAWTLQGGGPCVRLTWLAASCRPNWPRPRHAYKRPRGSWRRQLQRLPPHRQRYGQSSVAVPKRLTHVFVRSGDAITDRRGAPQAGAGGG